MKCQLIHFDSWLHQQISAEEYCPVTSVSVTAQTLRENSIHKERVVGVYSLSAKQMCKLHMYMDACQNTDT